MYYSMIAFVALVIFAILSLTVFFRVDKAMVKGSSRYSAAAVVEASGINGGDNLIRTNLSKCSEKIESELIYIEEAKLTRSFPSTVLIEITPCVETASVEYEGKFYLLSKSGKILEITDEPVEGTITIYGAQPAEPEALPSESDEKDKTEDKTAEEELPPAVGEKFRCRRQNRTDILYQLINVSETAMNGRLRDFDMSDYLNISSVYDERITIEFGSVAELDYKLKLASKIISTKIGPETEGTLTMLSNGASFIDKAGLEQNEQTYLDNISAPDENDLPQTDTDNVSDVTSEVIHFE